MAPSKRFAGALVALAMTACSAMRGGTLPPGESNPASPQAAAVRGASMELRLLIPKRNPHTHYVSPSTQSISVSQGTKKLGTFNTTPASKGCSAANGTVICSFKLGIKTGKHQTFAVTSYDATNGGGSPLSTGSVTKTIVAGLNVIPITMSGVVSSIALALQNPNATAGSPASLRVTVMAQDADGNTIVGPGKYSVPITLTDSDTTGATALTTSTVLGPSQSGVLAYAQSGMAQNVTSATIGATANGVTKVTTAVFAPTPAVAGSFVLPTAIGAKTNLSVEPRAIVGGPDGNLWMSADDGVPGDTAMLKMTPGGTFTTFVPGTAPSTNLPNDAATGLAVGSDGNVWYVGHSDVGNINPSTGAATNYPFAGIAGLCAGSGGRIVPAADGGLWFVLACKSSTELVHMSVSGAAVASALPPNFLNGFGLVLAKDGNLYVTGSDNMTSGAVLQATVSGATVTGTSIVDVGGTGTGLYGITQTADGDLWATNFNCAPSMLARVHLASGFVPASVTAIPTLAGCAVPANPLALGDGTLWFPDNSYATLSQVVPNGEAAPALFDLLLPGPPTVGADYWDVAQGRDGYLYGTNATTGENGFSSNVVKVAY